MVNEYFKLRKKHFDNVKTSLPYNSNLFILKPKNFSEMPEETLEIQSKVLQVFLLLGLLVLIVT